MEDSEGTAAAHDNHQNRNGAAESTSPATRPLAVDLGDEFTDAELDPEALREQVSPDYDLLPEVDAPGSAPRGDRIGRHGRHHHEHPAPRRGEEEQLDLRKLLLFERAVSAGSLSAAAVELGWSQPAVSQQLSTLEHSLGTRLLTRTTRGVVPTPAGRILLGRAEAIRAQARGALEDLRSAVSPVDQTLRIAAFPSLLGGALAPSLEQLVGGGGGGFEVLEHEPPEALDLLRRGRVDVALIFRHGPGEAIPSGHRAVVLGVDRHALILPRRWGLDRDVRELADAEDLPWVAGCRRCTQHLTQVCEAAGFTPAIRHVTDDPQAIQALVAHGLGVALIPRLALRTPGATGFADRLDVVDLPQLVPREITAVHPESWTGTARLDELISALRGRL
ncbi:LysR family transcriptional regulator [Nesterenkonia sp. CL21]|uniref:LysR family transcriptional regulator n=1 Tax=Nesterenkonia sp. CL21 TaxID=3064894 RepID=UPI00287ACAA2|nr:LysR family transcriptional regulator [Nesterenkonia sp. CL21]MDS2174204.1 LysR family transcriptional regulator [Nesterenkonia sp. CL21]